MATPLTAPVVDLRVVPVDGLLDRVQRSLQIHFVESTLVRKRRSVGGQTDHGTWVRIERRPIDKIAFQGWNGAESTAALHGVALPEWRGCVVWRDGETQTMWRADEMDLLPGRPVANSVLTADPDLPDTWWQALNASLNALAAHNTTRVATPDTVTITQGGVTDAIRSTYAGAFPTRVQVWQPAHADLTWANVTGPQFCLFDWEDWGNAPRGLDAATLWANALLVPELAARVWSERHDDLQSQDGKLMTLFACSKILGPHAHPEDPRKDTARQVVDQIIRELQSL